LISQAIGPNGYFIQDMNDRGQILIWAPPNQAVVLTPTTP
jgi:hypothetical protein